MLGNQDVRDLVGRTVYSTGGEKIGDVGQVYLDDQSNQPKWLTVKTGFFGSNESFVPVEEASLADNGITVPFDKDKVKNAPNIASDAHISETEEEEIYRYYGLTYSGTGNAGYTDTAGVTDTAGSTTGHTDTAGVTDTAGTTTGHTDTADAPPVGHDTSGPTTDSAMTRSEERLEVGTESHEAGRARLRKWVETDTETVTVPVTKERAVVEREPITDHNVDEALDGPAISEEEHEVVLKEERPVVDKHAEPVERVRLDKAVVTDEETVSGEVRKEHVEVEGDTDTDVRR
jgi:uncharacterized protein (TIGR02271 family)